ncbi:TraE/TraK family type IV conjugative transfer system protein [Aeromonas enteropelogenes]|uniref:TraE/TraK family type IV conjugative transfer system protein n=1 Tax=Aeromonas enteropelogenes TaxID=29489 RepID=UPI003F7911B6
MTALTSWSTAMVRTNIAQLTNFMLGVALLGMTWMHWNTKPTVIIKPPVLTGEIRIEDGLPNKEWQESWALYLSHMLGNINPRNVDFVTRTTISLLSPKLQMSKEADIRRMVEMMKMSNLTQSFEVQISSTIPALVSFGSGVTKPLSLPPPVPQAPPNSVTTATVLTVAAGHLSTLFA